MVTFSEAVSATASAFTVDNCTVGGDVGAQFSAVGLPGNTATLTNWARHWCRVKPVP
ncbi:MAG: hypothetical protein R3F53_28935 [Gammaproteobacteria bacterium]